jgi:hypothetical protein
MAATKNPNRQCPEVAICEFTYADLTSGSYDAMVDLPLGAIVVGGFLAITELFNSATTDKFSIGDKRGDAAADVDTLAAQSADVTAVGRAAEITPTGEEMTAASTVGVVWTGDGTAPTAGAGILVVEYIQADKAESTFEA